MMATSRLTQSSIMKKQTTATDASEPPKTDLEILMNKDTTLDVNCGNVFNQLIMLIDSWKELAHSMKLCHKAYPTVQFLCAKDINSAVNAATRAYEYYKDKIPPKGGERNFIWLERKKFYDFLVGFIMHLKTPEGRDYLANLQVLNIQVDETVQQLRESNSCEEGVLALLKAYDATQPGHIGQISGGLSRFLRLIKDTIGYLPAADNHDAHPLKEIAGIIEVTLEVVDNKRIQSMERRDHNAMVAIIKNHGKRDKVTEVDELHDVKQIILGEKGIGYTGSTKTQKVFTHGTKLEVYPLECYSETRTRDGGITGTASPKKKMSRLFGGDKHYNYIPASGLGDRAGISSRSATPPPSPSYVRSKLTKVVSKVTGTGSRKPDAEQEGHALATLQLRYKRDTEDLRKELAAVNRRLAKTNQLMNEFSKLHEDGKALNARKEEMSSREKCYVEKRNEELSDEVQQLKARLAQMERERSDESEAKKLEESNAINALEKMNEQPFLIEFDDACCRRLQFPVTATSPTALPATVDSAILPSQPTALLDLVDSAILPSQPTALPATVDSAILPSQPTALPATVDSAILPSQPIALLDLVDSAILPSQPTALPDLVDSAILPSQPTALPATVDSAVLSSQPTALPATVDSAILSSVRSAVFSSQPTALPATVPTPIPAAVPTPVPAAVTTPVFAAVPTADHTVQVTSVQDLTGIKLTIEAEHEEVSDDDSSRLLRKMLNTTTSTNTLPPTAPMSTNTTSPDPTDDLPKTTKRRRPARVPDPKADAVSDVVAAAVVDDQADPDAVSVQTKLDALLVVTSKKSMRDKFNAFVLRIIANLGDLTHIFDGFQIPKEVRRQFYERVYEFCHRNIAYGTAKPFVGDLRAIIPSPREFKKYTVAKK